jgi:hypothetical protein
MRSRATMALRDRDGLVAEPTYQPSGDAMKTKLLILSTLFALGLAQAASAAVDTGKVANGDGSSSSLTCLQDVNCK